MSARTRKLLRRMLASAIFIAAPTLFLVSPGCSGGTTVFAARPFDIEVTFDSTSPTNSLSAPLPILFNVASPQQIVVNLRVRDDQTNTVTSFTGSQAWVQVSITPGTIISSQLAGDTTGTSTAGPNVLLTDGVAQQLTLDVVGSYGTAHVSAAAIDFVPADLSVDHVPECADGIDNDHNGYIDYPLDPNCTFLNDDTERPFDSFFGSSEPIYFRQPTISDVDGTSTSPFLNQQVEVVASGAHEIVVTALTAEGLMVTDIGGAAGASNSLYVYNFTAPDNVQICDTITRLAGNLSIFYGLLELGTPTWTDVPWNSFAASGPCPVPAFTDVTANAGVASFMQPLMAGLISVTNPAISQNFGSNLAPNGVPAPGASNCDLNKDGIVGFEVGKAGYSLPEANCEAACDADNNCTEWNDYLKENEVKISFPTSPATSTSAAVVPGPNVLFFNPSAVATFDPTVSTNQGPGVFALISGTLTQFSGGKPPWIISARCGDDLVLTGTDPTKANTVLPGQPACVRNRLGF